MSERTMKPIKSGNWRTRYIMIGAALGSAVGALAAYLLTQNTEEDQPLRLSPGEGVKMGVLVLGLLRSIANLVEDKGK